MLLAMTLQEFWADKGPLRELADFLGLEGDHVVRTVQRWLEHERIPDLATLRLIQEKTGGSVALADWPDHPVRLPKRDRVIQQAAA